MLILLNGILASPSNMSPSKLHFANGEKNKNKTDNSVQLQNVTLVLFILRMRAPQGKKNEMKMREICDTATGIILWYEFVSHAFFFLSLSLSL